MDAEKKKLKPYTLDEILKGMTPENAGAELLPDSYSDSEWPPYKTESPKNKT